MNLVEYDKGIGMGMILGISAFHRQQCGAIFPGRTHCGSAKVGKEQGQFEVEFGKSQRKIWYIEETDGRPQRIR